MLVSKLHRKREAAGLNHEKKSCTVVWVLVSVLLMCQCVSDPLCFLEQTTLPHGSHALCIITLWVLATTN